MRENCRSLRDDGCPVLMRVDGWCSSDDVSEDLQEYDGADNGIQVLVFLSSFLRGSEGVMDWAFNSFSTSGFVGGVWSKRQVNRCSMAKSS